MKKRFLCSVLTAMLVLGCLIGSAFAFSDVNASDWYYRDVTDCVNKGYFSGTSKDTFSPNGSMTRAMFVTVLYRYAGQPSCSGSNPFSDVKSGSYYEKAVIWAAENDIVNGTGKGEFSPDAALTREQLCTLLVRYCSFAGVSLKLGNADLNYSDLGSVSGYAYNAVATCLQAKILSGSGGKLLPQQNATRAQVAAMLCRFSAAAYASGGSTPPQPQQQPTTPDSDTKIDDDGNIVLPVVWN